MAVTDAGYITLLGQDLHIVKLNLDDGQLIVEGFILAMDYGDGDEAGNKRAASSPACSTDHAARRVLARRPSSC